MMWHRPGPLLEVVLVVFLLTLQLLLFVADRLGTAFAFHIAQCRALRLQLLLQCPDLIIQRLQVIALRFVLLLQVAEVALKLVGLGNRRLKRNDCDLGWGLGCRYIACSRQKTCLCWNTHGKTGEQCSSECKISLHLTNTPLTSHYRRSFERLDRKSVV